MPSITEVDNIKSLDDSGQTSILTKTGTGGSKVFTLDNVALGSSVVFPAGHVIQTQTNSITTSVENSSGSSGSPSWTDVISKAITPALGTKIIVCCSFLIGSNDTTGYSMWRILKDAATINVSTDTGAVQWINEASRNQTQGNFNTTSIVDLHGADGSTEVIYKLQLARQASIHNAYIGRGFVNNTENYGASAATHITLFEIQT